MGLELTAAQWAMASFALSATSTIAQAVTAGEQSSAVSDAAWDNYYANQNILAQQAKEIQQDSNNQLSERAIQAEIERGKLRAVAGEAGIAGNTPMRWFEDSEMQQSRDAQSIETNKSNKLKQNVNQQQSNYARARGQANEAASKEPSLLGTGLQIAGAAANYGYKTSLPDKKT